MRALRLSAFVFLAATHCFVSTAFAGVLYTWTDAGGRVQYSDRPPKNFDGPVKRIEIDAQPAPAAAPPKTPPAAKAATPAKSSSTSDIGARRHADRERLQRELDLAREKLAAARKALAEHPEPGIDERQIVQRPAGSSKGGTMPGTISASTRMNCRTQEKDGKKIVLCPVSAPTAAYYERIERLEEEVRRAEEELATAERAYRRGTD